MLDDDLPESAYAGEDTETIRAKNMRLKWED